MILQACKPPVRPLSASRSFGTAPLRLVSPARSLSSPSYRDFGLPARLRSPDRPIAGPSSRPFSSSATPQATLGQALRGARKPRARRPKAPVLAGKPQRKAVCSKIFTLKPRKPNSAERKVAKVKLADGTAVTAYIMGEGHNLQEHSVVLIRGGRTVDLVGVKYRLVRGALDFNGVAGRTTSRSLYGVKRTKLASK